MNNVLSIVHPETDTKSIGANSNAHAANGVSFDAGLNAAVQKALQAVLAIDPSLNDAVQQILPQAVLATQNVGNLILTIFLSYLIFTQALKASEASERSATASSQERSAVVAEPSHVQSRMKEGEIDADPESQTSTDQVNYSSHVFFRFMIYFLHGQNDSASMMTEDGVAMLRPGPLRSFRI